MNYINEIKKARHDGNWAREKVLKTGLFRTPDDIDWAEQAVRDYGWDAFYIQYVVPEQEKLRLRMHTGAKRVELIKDADGKVIDFKVIEDE